jgi:hypothetical protein
MENNDSANFRKASIYTLAQSRTESEGKPHVILRGKGSEIHNADYGKHKGKRKVITQTMALRLIDIAKEKGKDVQPFWNTYHCQSRICTHDGKVFGDYCKNRFCTTCTAIRKAEKINAYYPIIKEWPDPYFLTLTVKAVKKDNLKAVMKSMIKGFREIVEKYRKRALRKAAPKLRGIRSLECNFNNLKSTYNPHFHLILPDKQTAEILRKEWLAKSASGWTSPKAQYMRRVEDLERDLIETIKYGTKIFTEPKEEGRERIKGSAMIFVRAYYNIIEAMNGIRIFERFGINLPKKNIGHKPAFVTTDYEEWVYMPECWDWQNKENELLLTAFIPQKSLVNLLETNIDTYRE